MDNEREQAQPADDPREAETTPADALNAWLDENGYKIVPEVRLVPTLLQDGRMLTEYQARVTVVDRRAQ